MAIEKSLNPAPLGLDSLDPEMQDTPGLEIDMLMPLPEDGAPVIIEMEDGGVEITYGSSNSEAELAAAPFDANLAEYLDDTELAAIASELTELIEEDINARKDWADTLVRGMDALGFKYETRTEPWENACGVHSTLLAEAVIRFQAEAMGETFPAQGPVKTMILGEMTKEKEDAAKRVKEDMNYELTEVMVEYRTEHERMLYSLGLAGSAFKKVYYNPGIGRQTAIYIPAEDVIVPYGASNIEHAERVTHVMRKTKNEMERMQAAGFYVDIDLGEPVAFHSDIEEKKAEEAGYSLTNDNRYALYEVHTEMRIDGVDGADESGDDLDDTGLAKPYVVTIDRGTGKVLSIYRNWVEGDELYRKRQHFVHYIYLPGEGFYGFGLIHILGGYAMAGTALTRQLVDSGTLSNLPGGLKTRGLRVKGDDTPIGPGEFRDVDVPSGSIRDNIMALPYKEPSQTLLALLNRITEEGRRLGAISDVDISDMSANAPVGTTLALLERALKPMSAVQARVHFAMKLEFKLLKKLIAEHAPQEYTYIPERGAARARQADYAMVEVIPVSDPNSSTMAQRVVQYQAVIQLAQGAPQIYDLPVLHRQMIEVLGVKNADKLIPLTENQKPADPLSENMNVLVGKPIKAFIYQDHDAHLATHTSFMQDPMIAQAMGQNPMAQQMMGALQAHLAEHLAFKYRRSIEEKLGVQLPAPNEIMPEEIELQFSRLLADAAKQLMQQNQAQAAQQQAQEQQQDPLFQLQMQETQAKVEDVKRKAAKDQADNQIKQQELALKDKQITIDAAAEAARIDASIQQQDQLADVDAAESILGLLQPPQQMPPPGVI